jgi:hypothetical protein
MVTNIRLAIAALSVVFVCVIAAQIAHPAFPRSVAAQQCGDVNDDDEVTATDALAVLKAAVGQSVELICATSVQPCWDLDADGFCAPVEDSNDDDLCDALDCTIPDPCGNGTVDEGEDCDFGDLNSETCATLGMFGDGLRCGAHCVFDTSSCSAHPCWDLDGDGFCAPVEDSNDDDICDELDCTIPNQCGNGIVDVGEDCDFGDLNSETCATLGMFGDGLRCGADCVFDTSGCSATQYEDTGVGTVIDHETGLEWEKKTAGNVSDVFRWEDAFAYVHGVSGDAGAPPTGSVQGLGGHSDWRLPSHTELQTLLLEPFPCGMSPCIDPIFGPTAVLAHWTATTAVGFPDQAWGVAFGTAFVNFASKSFGNHVRAVRHATPPPSSCPATGLPATGQMISYGPGSDGDVQAGAALSYVDNGDGTITDLNTGLIWEKKDDSGGIHDMDNVYSWSTGTNYMDGTMTTSFLATLNGGDGFAGHTDWRIPNYRELQSILDVARRYPTVDPVFHQSVTCMGCSDITQTACSCTASTAPSVYWTSTTIAAISTGAWIVDFAVGSVFSGDISKTSNQRVRAVRGGL